jgi:hypothetical protein
LQEGFGQPEWRSPFPCWPRDAILKVDIGHRYPLAVAADAHRDLETRRTTGSILLLS